LIIEVYVEKKKDERKADIVSAFYSAYFSRLKTLSGSDLETVLKSIDEAEQQEIMSDEEMFARVKRLSASLGG